MPWPADAGVTIIWPSMVKRTSPWRGHAKHRRLAFRNFAASLDGGVNGYRAWPPEAISSGSLACAQTTTASNRRQLKASALASHSDRTPADGSAGLAHGGSCHAHTVNSCPTRAAGGSDLRDHAVRLRNRRRRHSLRRCDNR